MRVLDSEAVFRRSRSREFTGGARASGEAISIGSAAREWLHR